MRAILRTGFGGPDVLVIREMPEPEPKDGHVVIDVKAFGITVVACTISWLMTQVWAMGRTKMLYVEPAGPSSVSSVAAASEDGGDAQ